VDACPDLETLAGYLDGRLTERERADIAAHVAECETCYFVFTEAAQTRASDSARAELDVNIVLGPTPLPAPRWWATPRIAWSSAVGLAAAACLMLAVGMGLIPWRSDDSAELRALVAAVGTQRTIEPRLTGGFAYGQYRSGVLRGADPLAPDVSPDVRIAAARMEKATGDDPTAQALRELGIAALVTGDHDRAIKLLEHASERRPGDAKAQSDLAAAYLTRAAHGSADDAAKALAAANRAVTISRTMLEALFNRAYALDRMGMKQEAREAWRAYLVIDDQSGWAEEARAHLRQLEERP